MAASDYYTSSHFGETLDTSIFSPMDLSSNQSLRCCSGPNASSLSKNGMEFTKKMAQKFHQIICVFVNIVEKMHLP